MNKNWNVNNRGLNNWGEWRGGRGRGGNRGSWGKNNYVDHQMPYPNQRGGFRGGNRNSYRGRNPNQGQWNKPNRDSPGKRLSEEEIGVTEYMSDHKGFNGIIKCRYSDFQVSEINENGEIAKLTDMSPPLPPAEEAIDEDEDLLLSKYNLEILPLDTWDRINGLVVNSQPTNKVVEVDVTGMTKEERTRIHDAVKKAFGTSIVGSTVAIDDKKFVKFEKYRKGVRIDNRVKWVWPGEYVYFIVHKENCDTMEAAARITEKLKLNLKPSMLGYAGTKDRRAKTSQWFSLRKVDPRRIAAAAKAVRDVYVGNFTFSPINLKLGMLTGNRFRIALRNVRACDDKVSSACSRLRERGFLNYYGLQRFGARPDAPTYEVGRLLLQGNYQQAINYILEDEEQRPAGGRNAGGARLRRALSLKPRDYIGALDQLARNQRVLYLHAYQSLIWNKCASQRMKTLGSNPVPGDLVPLHCDANEYEKEEYSDDEDKDESTSEDKFTDEKTEDNISQTDEIEESMTDSTITEDKKEAKHEKFVKNVPKPKIPVKVLTEEDIASGNYTIFDVVLPVPGYNIEYPPNMVEYYRELLEKDNLKLDMRHKKKSFSLSGAYRCLCVRPGSLKWRSVFYRDPNCDLQLSDLQKLQGKTEENTGIVPERITKEQTIHLMLSDLVAHGHTTSEETEGPYKALLLSMTLPSSSYATMALRELLKVDTANDSQALQNDYYKKPQAPFKERDEKKTNENESKTENEKSIEDEKVDEKQSDEGNDETQNEEKDELRENKASSEDTSTSDDVKIGGEEEMQSESQNGDRAEKRKMESDETEAKKSKQDSHSADENGE